MLTLFQAAIGGLTLYLLYYVYWELTTGASRRKLYRDNGCEPVAKLPDWDPILGLGTFQDNSRWIKEHSFLEHIQKRFAKMGVNTFSLKLLGMPVISTIEPENLKTIQSLDFKKWVLGRRRRRAFLPFLGPGIFSTDGQEWAHSREMLRPNFARNQVGDLATFETHVGHLIDAIPRDGSTVDLQELFFRLTIDSATEFLFGESTNCLAPGTSTVSASKFALCFNRGQEYIAQAARFGRLAEWFFWGRNKQFLSDCAEVHEFVDSFVEKAFTRHALGKTDSGRYIFADALVTQTSDKLRIRSELLNILLAGRDTTASLLSNVFHTLSRRRDIFAAVQAELASLNLHGRPPSFAELKELRYLRAVLNESLRLYPVVPGNSREAAEDTVLPLGGGEGGKSPMFVAKGTVVNWNVYTLHRRKDYFGEDADEFRPERWLDGEDGRKGLRPGWEYLPFNGGARICLGQQFALTEASYTTVRLLQEFKAIEARDPRPWMEWFTLTCTGWGGCKVALAPA